MTEAVNTSWRDAEAHNLRVEVVDLLVTVQLGLLQRLK